MPSLTETHLCDRFTAWKQGFYLGVEDKNECMSSSAIQTPVFTPNRASHTDPQTAAGGDNPAACGGGQIQFLTYPLIIRFTLFSSGLHINAATSPPRLPGGHGQGRHGGGGVRTGKGADRRRGAESFSTRRHASSSGPGRCVPRIFLPR